VLNGKTPDMTPFAPFSELIPRAFFERELRGRGMGYIVHSPAVLCSNDTPLTVTNIGNLRRVSYATPFGELIEEWETPKGASEDEEVQTRFMIQDAADYRRAVSYIDAMRFEANESGAEVAEFYLGDDGVTHIFTQEPPYMYAQYFLGLENWSYHQPDFPDEFGTLLEALERAQEKRMDCALRSRADIICLGNLAGNFSPEAYKKYMLPYFQKYAPRFRRAGVKTSVHADALNLSSFKDLIPLHGVDIVEAFTPPPVGDLSLKDARAAWGEDVTIHINFPEAVFYGGYQATKDYARDLILSDPCPNKIMGMTELGFVGATGKTVRMFAEGVRAVFDAVEEYGGY